MTTKTTKHAPRKEIVAAQPVEEVLSGEKKPPAPSIKPPAPSMEAKPVVSRVPASPLDLPVEDFRAGLDRRKANRAVLMEWVRSALVEAVDYGRIHTAGRTKCPLAAQGRGPECTDPRHWSKPILFKPGAEKICGMLGVTVHYPNLTAYEQAALADRNLGVIILRCELHDGQGRVVAEGVGARNVQQDYGDLNKALKMAEKSAHIDTTLRMAGLSEVFTQDLEDMARVADTAYPPETPPAPDKVQADWTPVAEPELQPITDAQVQRLEARIDELGLDKERVRAWMAKASRGRFERFTELIPAFYDHLYGKLEGFTVPMAQDQKSSPRE